MSDITNIRHEGVLEAESHELVGGTRQTSVYVYEAPVRLWHWINAIAILVLALTGFFIGRPLPTMPATSTSGCSPSARTTSRC